MKKETSEPQESPVNPGPKVDVFMRMYWRDYLADTQSFDAREHGAYMLLIAEYWMNGGPISADEKYLKRLTRLSGRGAGEALQRVLSKFKLRGHCLHHKRCDKELRAARSRMANYSERGQKGANARWNADASSMQQACNKQCLGDAWDMPIHRSSTPSTNTRGALGSTARARIQESPPPDVDGVDEKESGEEQFEVDRARMGVLIAEYGRACVDHYLKICANHCRAKKITIHDFASFVENWILKDRQEGRAFFHKTSERDRTVKAEHRQRTRTPHDDKKTLEHIGKIINTPKPKDEKK